MMAMLEAAQRYAAHGWPVFPCESGGKRPRTHNGCLDATTDPGRVERWWRADGNANPAIRTGRVSGVVVLDVDGDEGADSLAELERRHGPIPRTASVITPRGGAHYYFKAPSVEIRNSAGKLGPGLDVRGDGGYVLVPPSIGANGRRYEPDERTSPVEMPSWLLDLTRGEQTRPRTPSGEWVGIVRAGLAEGQRNHGLARLAGHLLARDVDARLVLELVLLTNERCQPPLADTEVEKVVESIAGRELRRRRAA